MKKAYSSLVHLGSFLLVLFLPNFVFPAAFPVWTFHNTEVIVPNHITVEREPEYSLPGLKRQYAYWGNTITKEQIQMLEEKAFNLQEWFFKKLKEEQETLVSKAPRNLLITSGVFAATTLGLAGMTRRNWNEVNDIRYPWLCASLISAQFGALTFILGMAGYTAKKEARRLIGEHQRLLAEIGHFLQELKKRKAQIS
jgi:hypothetical protein